MDGDLPTEDFHLIGSCPYWAYTRPRKIATKRRGLDARKLAPFMGKTTFSLRYVAQPFKFKEVRCQLKILIVLSQLSP